MTDSQLDAVSELLNVKLIALGNNDREIDIAKAAMKAAIDEAKAPHLEKIDALRKTKKAITDEVSAIATTNRVLLTKGNTRKTISLRAGTISWRDSTSRLFDISDAQLLKLIRRLGGMRRFVTRVPHIETQAIKQDKPFFDLLVKKGAAHVERSETMTIKPDIPADSVIKDDNPYKIKAPREE